MSDVVRWHFAVDMPPLSLLLICTTLLSVSVLVNTLQENNVVMGTAQRVAGNPYSKSRTSHETDPVGDVVATRKTAESTNSVTTISDKPSAFWERFASLNKVCIGDTNGIKARPASDNFPVMSALNWTMSSTLMQAMMGVPLEQWDEHTSGTRSSSIPPCDTVEDIAQFFASAPARGGQQHCRLLWFDRPSYCALFNKFAGVMFSGDSLTRHMMQALHMIGSQNWVTGSYPCGAHSNCRCDGQVEQITTSV